MVMAFIAVSTIVDAAHPSGYRGRHWEGPWPYPTDAVVTWLSIMALEGLVICLVLRSRTRASLAGRALILAIGMVMLFFALVPLAMHAGTPIPEHFGWMALAVVWLVGFAIATGIANLVRARRARVPGGPRR